MNGFSAREAQEEARSESWSWLLDRPEVHFPDATLAPAVLGKRVLITGAGGSVGVPLAEKVAQLGAEKLVLLDQHEYSLFLLRQQLESAGLADRVRHVLGDVRDASRMRGLFRQERPAVVLHLAACKHVSTGEEYPEEAFSVNVLGTRLLLELVAEFGAESLAYPSSDKAVNPSSAYGAAKRVAEALVAESARRASVRFAVARFVNILGSRGSVLESFLRRIRLGQALPVTDPGMTRYWMTMQEAVGLLLATASPPTPSGSILLLEGLRRLQVVAIARRLWQTHGPGGGECPITVIGVRPGERLEEQLLAPGEHLEPGPLPGTLLLSRAPAQRNGQPASAVVEQLASMLDEACSPTFAQALKRAAEQV